MPKSIPATPPPGPGGDLPSELIANVTRTAAVERLAVSLEALQLAVDLVLLSPEPAAEGLSADDKALEQAGARRLLQEAFSIAKADAWTTINAVRALGKGAA